MLYDRRQSSPAVSVECLEKRLLWAGDLVAAISFGPADAEVPLGYAIDSGGLVAPQADSLTYGWDRDLSHRTRQAKQPSDIPGYNTFISMRRAAWSLSVPNGVYSVTVSAGNGAAGKKQRVAVEEVPVLDQKTTKQERWLSATADVVVTDGVLDVTPIGKFRNNKLAALEVRIVSTAPGQSPSSPPPASVTGVEWNDTGVRVRQTRVEAAIARVGTRLHVMGGYVDGLTVNRTSDIFDVATGKWTAGATIRGAETHAGVTSDGSRMIYKAGGQLGSGIPGTPTADVWQFDTLRNRWKKLPALPEARYAPGMALVDGTLHVFGGTLPDRTTVTTDHWTLDLLATGNGWQSATPLPQAGDHLSTVVLGGKIYAIGGEHGHAASPDEDAPYVQHDFHYAFDPASGVWAELAPLPESRSHAEGTTIAVDGSILFMGGKLGPVETTSRMDLYNPATDTWTLLGYLPAENQGGAAIYDSGRIYLSHGQIGGPDFTMHTMTWIGTLVSG